MCQSESDGIHFQEGRFFFASSISKHLSLKKVEITPFEVTLNSIDQLCCY